jgi:hypothetical protein
MPPDATGPQISTPCNTLISSRRWCPTGCASKPLESLANWCRVPLRPTAIHTAASGHEDNPAPS